MQQLTRIDIINRALIKLGRVRAKEAIDHWTTHGPGKAWPVVC